MTALKAPLTAADRAEGWTDELRREFQEQFSLRRSVLVRHGIAVVRPPARFDEWLADEGIRPGRLHALVTATQQALVAAADTP
ncbi:hypothetical protein GL263_05720 [Streptomyces durbertensis]|uniref:Uncharacterized protein n=1 Tax=Streptomyces durbertensis TaxID=2448886 RepID=A0ABR6ECL4_9ACTN|nr:hypothetical protein [Streptomyces durbertensis]